MEGGLKEGKKETVKMSGEWRKGPINKIHRRRVERRKEGRVEEENWEKEKGRKGMRKRELKKKRELEKERVKRRGGRRVEDEVGRADKRINKTEK